MNIRVLSRSVFSLGIETFANTTRVLCPVGLSDESLGKFSDKVLVFEKMTNASVLSEKKSP